MSDTLLFVLPWFFMALMFLLFARQTLFKGRPEAFGKSPARLLTEKSGRYTFVDIGGYDEIKAELKNIVEFLKTPQRFQQTGAELPVGWLLVGAPGSGKTLMARAMAGEANVPYFLVSGSDFVQMFVGVGASRVRDMFAQCRKHAPCMLFIDQIDAMGSIRSDGQGESTNESHQTLQQLLTEMDDLKGSEGIIVLAATNRPDLVDPALVRSGRFGRHLVFSSPDALSREQILNVLMRKVRIGPDVDARAIARVTPGLLGADLYSIVNEGALLAAASGKRLVGGDDLWKAVADRYLRKIAATPAFQDATSSNETIAREALYAAGQLIVARRLGALAEDSVIAIGRRLTHPRLWRLPPAATKAEVEDRIAIALAGRAAECLRLSMDQLTQIAEDDLKYATELAEKFVRSWGFGDTLQIRVLPSLAERESAGSAAPPELLRRVEREISDVLNRALDRATSILNEDLQGLKILEDAISKHHYLLGFMVPALLSGGMTTELSKILSAISASGHRTGEVVVGPV